jgi:selenocysteine lyase/cysteine desulfurase
MNKLGEGVRHLFPALNRNQSSVFFDNAAGAQIPQQVLDAVNEHLLTRNVQRGGPVPGEPGSGCHHRASAAECGHFSERS